MNNKYILKQKELRKGFKWLKQTLFNDKINAVELIVSLLVITSVTIVVVSNIYIDVLVNLYLVTES